MGACLSLTALEPGTTPRLVRRFDRPLACGSDKVVYEGSFMNQPVAIAVAKPGHASRLLDEISILEELGKHRNIIELLHHSDEKSQDVFVVLERVTWDLDRLVNQHTFLGQTLPTSLTVLILQQVICGLSFMHGKNFIHRDLKLQNVLINKNHDVRLIDMGITRTIPCQETRWVFKRQAYLAPEVCQGDCQGVAVDCWGVGVLLHQIYQKRGDLVDASGHLVKMLPSRPSDKLPMAPVVREAMFGLLHFESGERWSLDELLSRVTQEIGPAEDGAEGAEAGLYLVSTPQESTSRRYLVRYITSQSPPTAYALHVTSTATPQLINKTIGELKVREKSGCLIVLIDDAGESMMMTPPHNFAFRFPGPNTIIKEDMWIYVGLPSDGDHDKAEEKMYSLFKNHYGIAHGTFLPFTLEFDMFEFPTHIGKDKLIGPGDFRKALDLRANFNLNLAGVLRADEQEPIWFPGPSCKVSAGDCGFIVRCPCRDGTTISVTNDEALIPLLDYKAYRSIAESRIA